MYGVVFSFKDSFDAKDMRSTGGGDAATPPTSVACLPQRAANTCKLSTVTRMDWPMLEF